MKRYSVFAIAREAIRFHTGWERRASPAPKAAYDAIIVGAGHGLATAYYLGKNFGITNVAIIEKGCSAAAIPAQHHDHPLELPAGPPPRSTKRPAACMRR
jgi:hypothetical protein